MSGVSTAAPPRQVRLEAPPTPPPAKPLAPHLIERESGVHALQEALKEAVAGQGALVVVDGAGGTGKSSLLDVARQRAAELGIQTLAARGRELETEFPFGLALELFEEAVAAAGSEARRQLLAGAAGLSAPLFDSPGPKAFLPSHDQGFALLHGLYWLTHNLAERTPLLIAVDDAQWADLPSLRFLVYLAERLEHVPIALVVSMRTSEVRHQPLLLQLRGQRQARVLELRPLTAEGTSELVHACLPRPAGARGNRTDNATHAPACSICRAFYEVTKGNPLLVREYLGAVRGEDLEAGEETAGRLRALTPPTLARIIQARLGRLSTQALSTARAIAVLGEHARLDHVAAVADISDSAAHAAVDELVAAEIAAPGNRPSLLHPVVQTITYGDLSESERSNLHERAARVPAAAGLPPEKLASHLLRTHPKGDDWVVATLWPAAVRASAAGSPQATVQYLRRALSEPPLPEVRPDLLADLGTAEAALGDPMAVDHLNDAVRFTRSRPRRAAVLADIGRTLRRYGRHREAA